MSQRIWAESRKMFNANSTINARHGDRSCVHSAYVPAIAASTSEAKRVRMSPSISLVPPYHSSKLGLISVKEGPNQYDSIVFTRERAAISCWFFPCGSRSNERETFSCASTFKNTRSVPKEGNPGRSSGPNRSARVGSAGQYLYSCSG